MARSLIRTLYSGTRSLAAVVKDARRAQQIATLLARHGFAALVARDRTTTAAAARAELLSGAGTTADAHADLAVRVVRLLEELGPTFVKFGQILSTRPDLIPPQYLERLEVLQDHVRPVPIDAVRRQVEASLGAPPEQLFASFDEQPIASASIAQVHGAVTKDGKDVVVKVQRPGLRPIVEADLSLLRFLADQVLAIFPEAAAFDLVGMVKEFEASLLRELDFTIEAQSLRRFETNFKDKPHIHIPMVEAALSSSTVLTMERVRGRKLTALTERGERERVAQHYLDAAYQMLFRDGFFHGDLHPGNVFLEDDGRLGLIDFGMVGRLSRQMRERLVDVLFALMSEDLEGVARIWFQLGRASARMQYAEFESAVVDVLERHIVGRPMEEWDLAPFFTDLATAAVRHGVRLPSDFTMMFKAMATTEGLARSVAQGINPIEAARPYIEALLRERYSSDRMKKLALVEGVRLVELARELPHTVDRIVTKLEQGDLTVRLKHEELAPEVTRLVRALNRGAVAVISAAALMAAALTLDKGPHLWHGFSPLSIAALFIVFGGLTWIGVGLLRGR
ncbi:MAG: phosphotransferase [Deltaproteobacteria bacterium]|nr:phosphotransferase [Deltaproteobacteria bacterium]